MSRKYKDDKDALRFKLQIAQATTLRQHQSAP